MLLLEPGITGLYYHMFQIAPHRCETEMSIKQNFHAECEAMINKQINMELYASYVYLSMTAFFSRFYILSYFKFL